MEWWSPTKNAKIPISKKSITEAAAQVKGLLLFFLRSFPRKKIKEAKFCLLFSGLFAIIFL
jgi:hypothetical protein